MPAAKQSKTPLLDRIEDGYSEATGHLVGLMHPEAGKVIDRFYQFNTPEARSAFAGTWLATIASYMNHTWPVIYELLALVRDRELFKRPDVLPASKQTFETFPAFFEGVLGRPFDTWADLEKTYHFVHDVRPELFAANLDTASNERRKYEAQPTSQGARADLPRQEENGQDGVEYLCTVHKSNQSDRADRNGISRRTQVFLDRLARDRPDLLERVNAGELRPKTAARLAGIIRVPTDQELARKAYRKLSPEERAVFKKWQDEQE